MCNLLNINRKLKCEQQPRAPHQDPSHQACDSTKEHATYNCNEHLERAKEKAQSRQEDQQALKEGIITPQELRKANSHFARLNVRLVKEKSPLV